MSNTQKLKQRRRYDAAPAQPTRPFWQSPIVWIFGLVAVALIATIALTAGDGSTEGVAETAFAEVIGTPLPQLTSPDGAIGQIVPTIVGQTFDGEDVRIDPGGNARLYGFFAHWCPHCQAELPRTTEWLESNDLPDGVEVVAVSTGVERTAANYPPSEWFAREEWPATVVVDDASSPLAAGFGLTGFPYWVATDDTGAVVLRVSGEMTTSQFESVIDFITPER
ncbi:MAG: TlpA family protein disulfide reductase [Acidimicrobiales bacterium]